MPAFQDVDTDVHTHPNRITHMIKRKGPRLAPNKKNGNSGMERLYDLTVHAQKQLAELKAQSAQITQQSAQITQQSAQFTEILALLRQGGSGASRSDVK